MKSISMWLPLFPILYAEIHYTIKGFSLIFRRRPEIVADAPYRVEPGRPIPLLVLLRDADRFPVTLHTVHAELRYHDGTAEIRSLLDHPERVASRTWHRVFALEPKPGFSGDMLFSVSIEVSREGKRRKRIVRNHNYPGLAPAPLRVFVAKHPLPVVGQCLFADLHHHSEFTSDQVEYGAPLEATAEIAVAMGLSAAAVTDHSYDLDDAEDSYRRKDPSLARWNAMREKCALIERERGFVFLPGEELSCGSDAGRNVHLLLLNQRAFIPGSGDSAEVWFRTMPEHRLREVLDRKEPGSLAFAAHPEHRFHFLQRLLLARGPWAETDYRHPLLDGLEILNGPPDRAYLQGLRIWIRLLLEGRRLFLIAGNDAHGAFNRTFQLGLPFLYLRENRRYLFGKSRTGILVDGAPSLASVTDAIGTGRAFITTGPSMILRVQNESGASALLGGRIRGERFTLTVESATTEEFGPFEHVRVWLGDLVSKREIPWIEIKAPEQEIRFTKSFVLENLKADVYVRGLAVTRDKRGKTSFCLTNPIWLERGSPSGS